MYISPDVKPYKWTEQEAYKSGGTAYRILVQFNDNPFKGALGKCWEKGWKDADSKDRSSAVRINYASEHRSNNRRPRMFDKDERPERRIPRKNNTRRGN